MDLQKQKTNKKPKTPHKHSDITKAYIFETNINEGWMSQISEIYTLSNSGLCSNKLYNFEIVSRQHSRVFYGPGTGSLSIWSPFSQTPADSPVYIHVVHLDPLPIPNRPQLLPEAFQRTVPCGVNLNYAALTYLIQNLGCHTHLNRPKSPNILKVLKNCNVMLVRPKKL